VEEYFEEIISSIRQALLAKHERTARIEQERQCEMERQSLVQAEKAEQEETERFEGLEKWSQVSHRCQQLPSFVAVWEHAV
jgi:hypothetical protein